MPWWIRYIALLLIAIGTIYFSAIFLVTDSGTYSDQSANVPEFSQFTPTTFSRYKNLPSYSQGGLIYPSHKSVPHMIPVANYKHANATFVILLRNKELYDWKQSMRDLEDRFNKRYGYPYVFLNDVPFTDDFMKQVREMTSAHVEFGLIPKEHWSYPSYVNRRKAQEAMEDMADRGVLYGGNESYHFMCRFNSGYFYRHPLLQKYRYYWRVEPGVKFHCDIDFDPFLFMHANKKKYGFNIALAEITETIPTLWQTTRMFGSRHPEYFTKENFDNGLPFLSQDGGKTYNGCHYWSNFEIADLEFFRSEAYNAYFDFLDRRGGFFYERWGDAPVHSIAAHLLLKPEEIYFFEEIGYTDVELQQKCACDPKGSINVASNNHCAVQYKQAMVNYYLKSQNSTIKNN